MQLIVDAEPLSIDLKMSVVQESLPITETLLNDPILEPLENNSSDAENIPVTSSDVAEKEQLTNVILNTIEQEINELLGDDEPNQSEAGTLDKEATLDEEKTKEDKTDNVDNDVNTIEENNKNVGSNTNQPTRAEELKVIDFKVKEDDENYVKDEEKVSDEISPTDVQEAELGKLEENGKDLNGLNNTNDNTNSVKDEECGNKINDQEIADDFSETKSVDDNGDNLGEEISKLIADDLDDKFDNIDDNDKKDAAAESMEVDVVNELEKTPDAEPVKPDGETIVNGISGEVEHMETSLDVSSPSSEIENVSVADNVQKNNDERDCEPSNEDSKDIMNTGPNTSNILHEESLEDFINATDIKEDPTLNDAEFDDVNEDNSHKSTAYDKSDSPAAIDSTDKLLIKEEPMNMDTSIEATEDNTDATSKNASVEQIMSEKENTLSVEDGSQKNNEKNDSTTQCVLSKGNVKVAKCAPAGLANNMEIFSDEDDETPAAAVTDIINNKDPVIDEPTSPIQNKLDSPGQDHNNSTSLNHGKPSSPIQVKPSSLIKAGLTTAADNKPDSPAQAELTSPVEDKPASPAQTELATPAEDKLASPTQNELTSSAEDNPASPAQTELTTPAEDKPANPTQIELISSPEDKPASPAQIELTTPAEDKSGSSPQDNKSSSPGKNKKLENKSQEAKECVSLVDDDDNDDIMVIDEDSNYKCDKSAKEPIAQIVPEEAMEPSRRASIEDKTISDNDDDVVLSTDVPEKEALPAEPIREHELIKANNTTELESKEKKEDKPLVPINFLDSFKTKMSEMTRADLEEFCLLKIVEGVVDRSNLSDIKAKLKTMMQNVEEWRKKAMVLNKQNRDLQIVLRTVQEEQKKKSDEVITPLKITRSVGMQVLMTENKTDAVNRTRGQKRLSNQSSNIQPQKPPTKVMSQPTKILKSPIPVPRLVPAQNNSPTKPVNTKPSPQVQNSTISSNSGGGKATTPNGIRTYTQTRAAEKRSFSVSIDLTDDEPPPAKQMATTGKGIQNPVRLVPSQQLLAPVRTSIMTHNNAKNSNPRQVYIPIGAPQGNIRPGQTIVFKNSANVRPRQPAPGTIVRASQPSIRTNVPRNHSKHPAPLPQAYSQPQPPNWKALPPAPDLKISKIENGIVVSWKIDGYQEDTYEEIVSYQLFAYQETNAPASTFLWNKIGDIKALPLPMACTLTQFIAGYKYYFAVRAVDIRSRIGPFSLPGSILLLNK